MRAALLLAGLALWQAGALAADDRPARHLRVERAVNVPPGTSGQTCAILDADVYAHAESESLNDMRLFAYDGGAGATQEVPFTLTESNTERLEDEPAAVRSLRLEGGSDELTFVFELEMPRRPYTVVELTLNAKDFVGSAMVAGRSSGGQSIPLGEFAVFDLSGEHLGRSTALALQESAYPELEVRLTLRAAPGVPPHGFGGAVVAGASVPPSRAAQTLYTAVAATDAWTQRGQDSVAALRLPAHVPVARLRMALEPGYRANFLRGVTISAKPDRPESADSSVSDVETVTGQISQVQLSAAGMKIEDRQMNVDAVLAANLRGAASVEIAVANGNNPALPLRSVQLEMRQRRICFEAVSGMAAYTLMYGDPELPAPVYDARRLFVASATPVLAMLGPEQPNPEFVPRAEVRPFLKRHPDFWWFALLAALAASGGVALRGVRHRRGAWR